MLACVGCGQAPSIVTGSVTKGGQALQVSEQGDIQIHFIQEENGTMTGQTFMASIDPSGHFEAEVPAGDYRIAVQQLDPYPNVDKLKGQFDQNKTPIKQSIKGGDTLDIDLSQYEK
ncbi:hypothetical protein C5Y96_13695 [Blastopirellula marina]|uniref:Uncharacterized protein n=2 Tax=Pirellulales TaxID=2691354 RepID=A0A2S8FGT3_9BACT|nr:hypothetical protein C5Y96_13695 [Blastopirellula marina]RCS51782.1 DUF3823 domain-containing protein [Bremerella cremea]